MHPDKFLGRSSASIEPQYSEEERHARLLSLSSIIAEKRKDAVDARKSSGIEKVWLDCEEAHLGIDDRNRHEFSGARWSKPMSMVGPVTTSRIDKDDSQSSVFVRVTSRYVFGASSKLAEILLPIDDKAFKIEATPNPDLIKQSMDLTPAIDPTTGGQMTRPAVAGESPPGLPAQPQPQAPAPAAAPSQPITPPTPGSPPPSPPMAGAAPAVMPITVADIAQQQIDAANDAAEKAETRIYDWQVLANYPAEARKVIDDSARCGIGILKGPFPDIKKSKAVTRNNGKVAMQIKKKIIPAVKWVDFWNIYPDDACGENIHNGDYIFEKDYLSAKQLRALKGQDGYLNDKIDLVIEEGPGKIYAEGGSPNDKKNRKRYEIWYFYGVLQREDMQLLNAIGVEDLPKGQDEVHAIVSMVNDTIIRAIINPLDSGNFPYQAISWSRRPGHWAGVGVAEQMTAAQRMVNAATRALLNNAGLSCGPQIIIDRDGMIPADGNHTLYPNKVWYKTPDSLMKSVQDAFYAAIIPSVQQEMQAIIDYGMKIAEESTGIPLVTQGQTGPSSPETFAGAQLQDNNAHTWLRSIAERYDDQITEPLVNDYYEWLLLDTEVPDEEKGDFTIHAEGSSAMVERAIQEQFYLTLLGQVAQPGFKLNPEKLMAELLKSKRLDPRKIQYSEEEQKQQSQQPPPPDVRVQVEQIKGQNAMELQKAEAQSEQQKLQLELQNEQAISQNGTPAPHMAAAQAKIADAQIKAQTAQSIQARKDQTDLQQAQIEAQMARDDRESELKLAMIKRDMMVLELSMKSNMSLQEVHAGLANQGMQENTKRQLAIVEAQLDAGENDKQRNHEMNMANLAAANSQALQSSAPTQQ